jgi:hypothetical protein
MNRRTSEQWLAMFDQHKVSGLTQTEFAKQQGIDRLYQQPPCSCLPEQRLFMHKELELSGTS